MKYDKRIINPVENICTPFDATPDMDGWIDTAKGYFAVNLESFYNLDECDYGVLKGVRHTADDEYEDMPYQAFIEKGERKGMIESYSYFLFASDVKFEKKKWRPFTLDEFLKRFPLLSPVTLRTKSGDLYTLCVTGQGVEKETQIEYVILGGRCYDFEELLNKYDLQDENGNWTPFGVEE